MYEKKTCTQLSTVEVGKCILTNEVVGAYKRHLHIHTYMHTYILFYVYTYVHTIQYYIHTTKTMGIEKQAGYINGKMIDSTNTRTDSRQT